MDYLKMDILRKICPLEVVPFLKTQDSIFIYSHIVSMCKSFGKTIHVLKLNNKIT